MPFRAGSAEEMASSGDFKLLPEDEYLGEVTDFEFIPKENQQPTMYGPPQDQYKVTIVAKSFADGSPLEDTDGNAIEGGTFPIKTFINHNRMGIGNAGPSKARKFFAALLQQPINDRIEIEDPFPQVLVGKSLYFSTMNKKDTNGGEWTRVQDFRPLKINRQRRSAASQEGQTTGVQEQAQVEGSVAADDDDIKF